MLGICFLFSIKLLPYIDHDSNGFWDENEVRALFIQELNKLYESGASEDDMRERREEMERMREEVFKKADANRDDLISYDEFIAETKRDEFQRDENWDTVDQAPQFTHEEYLEFERQRQEEIKRLIEQGAVSIPFNFKTFIDVCSFFYSCQHIQTCHTATTKIR